MAKDKEVLRTNDIVAKQAGAADDFVAAMPHNAIMEFVKDHSKHCKTILALGAGRKLLELAGIEAAAEQDPGIILAQNADAADIASTFIDAVAAHRHPSREIG